ncbi:hypothetical protein H7J86_32335 [Mycobacterium hackensackense]|uniref:hypothetical protein n=1 Tax=Mycobacterium hackensackense TaxID=228909 RepID=UPI002265AC1E|nr:hypothetical protein [Mycobacterium hackensackense]MCV7256875.1 hypothetical protein [Mycobacterium hackensackense]
MNTTHIFDSPDEVVAALSAPGIQRAAYVSRHRQVPSTRIDWPHIHDSKFAAINLDGPYHTELNRLLVEALRASYPQAVSKALIVAAQQLAKTPQRAAFDVQRTVIVPTAAELVARMLFGDLEDAPRLSDLMVSIYFAGPGEVEPLIERVLLLLQRTIGATGGTAEDGKCIQTLLSRVPDRRFAYVNAAAFATAGFQNLAAVTGSALSHCLSDCNLCNGVSDVERGHVLRSLSFQHECFAREACTDLQIGAAQIRTGDEVRLQLDSADRLLEQIVLADVNPAIGGSEQTFKFGWGPHRCPAAEVSSDFVFTMIGLVKRAHPGSKVQSTVADVAQIVRPIEILLAQLTS